MDNNDIASLLKIKLVLDFIISLVFVFSGLWLVYYGSPGNTEIQLFGQRITSADAGVTVIFLSAVVLIMVTRRFLKTAEMIIHIDRNNPPVD